MDRPGNNNNFHQNDPQRMPNENLPILQNITNYQNETASLHTAQHIPSGRFHQEDNIASQTHNSAISSLPVTKSCDLGLENNRLDTRNESNISSSLDDLMATVSVKELGSGENLVEDENSIIFDYMGKKYCLSYPCPSNATSSMQGVEANMFQDKMNPNPPGRQLPDNNQLFLENRENIVHANFPATHQLNAHNNAVSINTTHNYVLPDPRSLRIPDLYRHRAAILETEFTMNPCPTMERIAELCSLLCVQMSVMIDWFKFRYLHDGPVNHPLTPQPQYAFTTAMRALPQPHYSGVTIHPNNIHPQAPNIAIPVIHYYPRIRANCPNNIPQNIDVRNVGIALNQQAGARYQTVRMPSIIPVQINPSNNFQINQVSLNQQSTGNNRVLQPLYPNNNFSSIRCNMNDGINNIVYNKQQETASKTEYSKSLTQLQ